MSADVSTKSDEVLHLIKSAFERNDIKYKISQNNSYITLAFQGDKVVLDVVIFWSSEYISIHVMYPFVVSPEKLPLALKVLNDLSVHLPLGGFEVHSSSKINYKFSLAIPPLPSQEELANHLQFAVSVADDHVADIFKAL